MKKIKISSLFCVSCCALVSLAALCVMIGWLSHDINLIKLIPAFLPMQFNSALLLFLCSIALGIQNRFHKMSALCAALVALFAIMTLLEYAFGLNLGIDTLFFDRFNNENVYSLGRMSPNTAFAFLLLSIGILIPSIVQDLKQAPMLAVAIVSGSAVALGALPLIGRVAGVEVANIIWSTSGHTAEHTGISLILLGICSIVLISRRNRDTLAWMPVPIGLGFLIITLILSLAAHIRENADFEKALQSEAQNISRKTQLQLNDLYMALDRMGTRWDNGGGTPEAMWKSDASAYLKGYPFLTALSVSDPDTVVVWQMPPPAEGTKSIVGYHLNSEPLRAEAIRSALQAHASKTSHVLTLLTGDKGFIYVTPLYVGERYFGVQVAAFRLKNLFGIILDADELTRVAVTIEDERHQLIFTNLPEGESPSTTPQRTAQITNKDFVWTLHVNPTPEFLASRNSFLPTAILLVGLLTTFLITLCTYLLTKWHVQNQLRLRLISELASSEELKRKIIDSSSLMIIASRSDGIIHTFNRAAEIALGYTAEELIGKKSPGIWHVKEEVDRRAGELTKLLGRPITSGYDVFTAIAIRDGQEDSEWTFVRKDGSRFPAALSATVVRDENGRMTGFLGLSKDISVEKENARQREIAEQKLRRSEERLYLAASGTSDGLWDWNVITDEVYYSPRFMKELGYGEYELPHTIETLEKLLHPDDMASTLKAIENDHTHIAPFDTEYRLRHKRGHYIWFNARGQTVWDAEDKPIRMTGFVTNIDKRKKDREALKKAHSELNLIFNHSNASIWFKDDKNNILRINDAAAKIMGGKPADYEGRNLADFFPDLADKYYADDLEVINSGEPKLRIIEPIRTSQKPNGWVSTDKIPYADKALGIRGVVAIATDITELKEGERQREQLVEQLTESNVELGRFAYVASHDMQEPLRMIANFSALLNKEHAANLDEEGRYYIEIVTQSARRMQQMVNDLLEYARVGNDTARFEPVNVMEEFNHVKDNLSSIIKELSAEVTADRLPNIKGNPVQFMRLLQNLIGNGMKYQKAGNLPRIHVGVLDEGEKWHFTIADNGIGMEAKYTEAVFEPFKRLHSWQEYQGTGIGLAVCKKIVENHGGTISITSEVGKGSVFHVVLPKAGTED